MTPRDPRRVKARFPKAGSLAEAVRSAQSCFQSATSDSAAASAGPQYSVMTSPLVARKPLGEAASGAQAWNHALR